ncbi:Mpv17-like protein 2 [Operophtera brumata]|uniref:Mpv17-like protein 2 n=1 Tax=Operophtera brumata TaxID=104452 RepID=A0A0L7L5Q2_OPEBR|nr:Mpv17-like protein 2 [Operophtera brumata]
MTIRRIFSKAYKTYKQGVDDAFNRKNLFYTNLMLSAGISACGDMLEQKYEIYKGDLDKFDTPRTFHMGFSGLTTGIICHHWYSILDKIIIGRTLYMVVKKLLLDQFFCSPIIILSFFGTVAIFEEHPLENFTEEVRAKFWTLYKAEWVVWPPAQLINFYFLPTKFRVVYDNTISLGYDIYTSQVKHSKPDKSPTGAKDD